jgi:hypothetical protein
MRGWIWPGVFALVYKLLQSLGLDQTFLIVSTTVLLVYSCRSTDARLTDFCPKDCRRGHRRLDGLCNVSPVH